MKPSDGGAGLPGFGRRALPKLQGLHFRRFKLYSVQMIASIFTKIGLSSIGARI
jgi:hypothetical protein